MAARRGMKVITKKIAEKSEKKEIKKRTAKSFKPPEIPPAEKKEIKRVKPKTKEKKTTTEKAKVGAEVEKKPKKAKIKEKPRKQGIGRAEEKPRKAAKKVIAGIKKELKKVEKKVVAKIEKKTKEVAKKPVPVIEEKIKKIPKAVAKREKRIVRGIKRVGPPKISKKLERKAEEKKKEVKVKLEEKKRAQRVEAKRIIGLLEEKIEAKVKAKEPLREEKYRPAPWEELPSAYGENRIMLMTVDPNKLFTYWEVREDAIAMLAGYLTIRVHDVTGVDFDGMKSNGYFDIGVMERIGSQYLDVSPGREFIADIGIVNRQGNFITIARSNKVSTPRITISEEGVLPLNLYETGLRVGYY